MKKENIICTLGLATILFGANYMLSQTANNATDDNKNSVKFQTEVNTKAMPVKKTKQTTTNKTLHAQNEVEDHAEKIILNKVPQGDYTLTSTGNDIQKIH